MGSKVLVVGSGGREHALAWRLSTSPSVDSIVTAPGNPGTEELGPNLAVDVADPNAVAELAAAHDIDLVVVGPEVPLVAGVVDELTRREIPAFGPTAAAAELEGSKAFAKTVMDESGVATAGWVETSDRDEAHAALDRYSAPYVIKADGLAGGKGVVISESLDEARAAVDAMLVDGQFGDASAKVVIEEYLDGPERSVFGVCDGTDVVLLSPAQDYKRALNGDGGLNTGGMGAFTPVPGFSVDEVGHLRESVFLPVLRTMAARGTPFRGLLYAGLIDTADGQKVLEFNVRFGDPETQVILPRMSSDLGELLLASATGSVLDVPVTWHDEAFVTVVLASGGYPETYPTGLPIAGIAAAKAVPGVEIFHAGTAKDEGHLVTAGGRVMNVVARGADVAEARAAAYKAANRITWAGQHKRTDIADL